MRRTGRSRCFIVVGTLAAGWLGGGASAWAQFGGGGMRPMGPGGGQAPPTGPEKEKEQEQAAEAAPESRGQEPTPQPLPAWPGQKEKALQFFQLNGYLRGRAYLFHALDLGINTTGSTIVSPFYIPFSEVTPTNSGTNPGSTCTARNGNNGCRSQDISGGDMRLRLEPIVNVSDQVRVKAQIDVFDNLVLGSTPEGYYVNGFGPTRDAPLPVLTRTQVPPTAGVNGFANSIVAKRAWAEVQTPIGELRFGRMGSHWGTGMYVNNGDCLDCDYGTNVDRLMFSTKAFNHFLVLMADWLSSGPTTALFNANQIQGVQYSADPLVGVMQYGLALGRQDKPEEVRERLEKGEVVVNYGGYFTYRSQGWDLATNPVATAPTSDAPNAAVKPAVLSSLLTRRNAWAFIPDLWFRLNWRKLNLEVEAVLIGGQIKDVGEMQSTLAKSNSGINILQYGWVAKFDYRLLRDTLHFGVEIGFASGDSAEDPNGNLNYRTAARTYDPALGTGTIGAFAFDPDYHVDLILYRRILGTVTNATYFKPHVQYDILDNLSGRIDAIYSIANNFVATPGNDVNLGLELDGSIWYHNDEEGFYAGVAYGVLFPFAGLNYPTAIFATGMDLNAQTAQTVQGRVAVKF